MRVEQCLGSFELAVARRDANGGGAVLSSESKQVLTARMADLDLRVAQKLNLLG